MTAEGDGGGGALRRPLVRPVAVEAYSGSYEFAPTTAEEAYNRGVAEAERNMDIRMGPLDGRWRIKDSTGSILLSLSLTDEGGSRPVEGAWRRDGQATELGVIVETQRSDAGMVLAGNGVALTLRASTEGWIGELREDGVSRSVTLVR